MKSTQKNQNKKTAPKKSQWQMPQNTQVIITPGAKKSIDSAMEKGEAPRLVTDRKLPKSAACVPAEPTPAAEKKKTSEESKQPMPLGEAVAAELKDRLKSLRLSIQLNSEDIIKGIICGVLLSFFALLQTTFFVRFAPFSKVPDLMLIFVLAVGVYEGEKWGSITGLVAAFIIQALGGSGTGPELLPLVYMPVGCAAGLLSKYYLRHTLPVKAIYVAASAFLRSIVTVITSLFVLDATIGDIIVKIALPEYLSTVLISPLPFFTVWLAFKHFHKTRAERTDSGAE